MKIALAQCNFVIGDFEYNKNKIIQKIEEAKSQNCDLIVFSELSVCGYPPDDLLEYPHFIENCFNSVEEITKHTHNITAIVGSPIWNKDKKGKRLFNAACVLSNGKWTKTIKKTLLPTYDVFNEARYFQANNEFNCVEINGIKTAITICEDLWDETDFFSYPEDPLHILSEQNPEIIINIAASPYNAGKEKTRYEVLKNQCIQYRLPMVYVNQIGAHNDLLFDGNSYFLNSKGEVIEELKPFEEDFKIIDSNEKRPVKENLFEDETEGLYRALVFGIKDYFQKMNFKKAVLGSSGGIDSAVVQALMSAAIGAENVTAFLMPSPFSSQHSIDDAIKLSENLNNEYHIIKINQIYDEFNLALKPIFKEKEFDVTEENLQARSRGVLLMAYSNKMGAILVNTTNKSEMSVGYGTLYGDMCGSLSILGDVFKTDVYKLAKFINKNGELIPENIIKKAPSAELRPNQKDSDSLPDYDILDKILYFYIEQCYSAEKIIDLGYDKETVNKVVGLINKNEFKRFQAPPVLRVRPKSFGRGRIIPLVSRFK